MKRRDFERYVMHDGVLKCCRCRNKDWGTLRDVNKLGRVWPVTDLYDDIDLHNWMHDISEKLGIPMEDFGK